MVPKIILGLASCSVLKRATNFEMEFEGKLDKSRCGEKQEDCRHRRNFSEEEEDGGKER